MLNFKKNPNHLLSYCLASVLLFLSLDVALFFLRTPSLQLHFVPIDLLWIGLGLLLCGLPSSLLHNSAHGNVGGKKSNRLVGAFTGTVMLYGFEGFRIGHGFHHRFPDNPQYDPHPPRGISFPKFLVAPIKATLLIIENAYYETYGKTPSTIRNIWWQRNLLKLSISLKIVFWFLLLGTKVFLLFYLPMYLSNLFVFAHINYATHIERADGYSQIINLNHGVYYSIANFLTFGGYFHKNHHRMPRAFDPSKIVLPNEKDLLTFYIPPKVDEITPSQQQGVVCL